MNPDTNEAEWSSCILTSAECGTELYLDVEDCENERIPDMDCCDRNRNDLLEDNIGCASYDINRSNSCNDLSGRTWENVGAISSTLTVSNNNRTSMNENSIQNALSVPTEVSTTDVIDTLKRNCEDAFGNGDGPVSEFLDGDVEDAYHAIFGEEIEKKGAKCSSSKRDEENKSGSFPDESNFVENEKNIEITSKNRRRTPVLSSSKRSRTSDCLEKIVECKDVLYSTGVLLSIIVGNFIGYSAEVIVVIDNRKIPSSKKSKYGGVHYVVAPLDSDGVHLGSCVLLPQSGLLPHTHPEGESAEDFISSRNIVDRNSYDLCGEESDVMINKVETDENISNCSNNSVSSDVRENECHEDKDTIIVNAMSILNKIRGASNTDCQGEEVGSKNHVETAVAPSSEAKSLGCENIQVNSSGSGSSSSSDINSDTHVHLSASSSSSSDGSNDRNGNGSIIKDSSKDDSNFVTIDSNCILITVQDSCKMQTPIVRKVSAKNGESINAGTYYQMTARHSAAQLRLDKYLALRTTDMRTVGRRVRVTADGSKYR